MPAARIRRSTSVAVVVRIRSVAHEEGEDPDEEGFKETGTSAACCIRTRCGSRSSSIKIFPIGDPTLETFSP
jgi:hypothetical protein